VLEVGFLKDRSTQRQNPCFNLRVIIKEFLVKNCVERANGNLEDLANDFWSAFNGVDTGKYSDLRKLDWVKLT
jgi:hypothetical protein